LRQPIDLARTAPFALGNLQIDPATRQLAYADGETETLEPRVMETLVALHRAGGAVLSRDDLTEACWRGNVVGEDAIQRVIQRLRKVAGLAGSFRIDTITKAGYRGRRGARRCAQSGGSALHQPVRPGRR
jgi:DNA-binding winged helix-turn-helix (wHTH) protein